MAKFHAFEFGEIRFTKAELKSLDKNVFALVVGSSIAANDVATFQRLALFHGYHKTDSDLLKTYIGVNTLIIFRTLSAKVYEYVYFIEGHAKKLHRTKSKELDRFLKASEEFLLIKNDPEFVTIKELRDNITHHYYGATVVSNLDTFHDDHEFSVFLHRTTGNSLSPLGEDIGTFGILRSLSNGIDIDRVIAWTIEASGKVTTFQHQSMVSILRTYFPDKKLKMRKVPVDRSLVGTVETRSPLLFKK